MSSPTRRPSATGHPTRQQLDDLDALMQRMLALPVEAASDDDVAVEPALPAAPPVPRMESPPSVAPTPIIIGAAKTTVALAEATTPTSLQVPPSLDLSVLQRAPAPPPAPPRRPEPPQPFASDRELAPPIWLLPAVWVNQVFDAGTYLLGPLGRGGRTRAGRALLGWTGLILFAGAVAWMVADGMGWSW